MLSTYIYYQLPPTYFSVCYTIFRETTELLAQKHILFAMLLYNVQYTLFFKYAILLRCLKNICISSFWIVKILKVLVKILSCRWLLLFITYVGNIWNTYIANIHKLYLTSGLKSIYSPYFLLFSTDLDKPLYVKLELL
jgi:hypothetical protein